jgi:hypothetical protein
MSKKAVCWFVGEGDAIDGWLRDVVVERRICFFSIVLRKRRIRLK